MQVLMLMGAACAQQDTNLRNTVHKNLKWIRPPTAGQQPTDIDAFFNSEKYPSSPQRRQVYSDNESMSDYDGYYSDPDHLIRIENEDPSYQPPQQ